MRDEDFSTLDLKELYHLFFQETRAFMSALDIESAEQIRFRRIHIKKIEQAIEKLKNAKTENA